jgi:endo-1,4-beta-xylanase
VKGEWWLPPTRLRTDDAGRVEVRGFLGDYQLNCAGHTASFTVATPSEAATTARLEQ